MEAAFNPYAPPLAEVGEVVDPLDQIAARRISRFAAALIDGLTLGVPLTLPVLISHDAAAIFVALAWIGVALFDLLLLARYGQTIGKRALRIRIVRNDGTQAGLTRLVLLRIGVMGLIGLVPIVGTLVQLADPLVIFGQQRRCLHDFIADTKVVVMRPDPHGGAAAESWAW